MCQNLDVKITNGRFGVDSSLPTCKDVSVVDYFLVSTQLFVNILDMKVKFFDPLISDVHNAIELYLHSSFFECNNDIVLEEENEALSPITLKYKWSEEETVKFVESVSNDKLLEIENDLDMLLKLDNIDYDNVECISGRFCKLIDEAAAECNMKKEFSANRNASVLNQKKPMKKKWFNNM